KDEAVSNLTQGDRVDYMGFRIGKERNRLRFALRQAAWDGLAESLELAQREEHAPIRAILVLIGWVGQKGPCYQAVNHDAAFARIAAMARKQGFDEIPSRGKLKGLW